MSEAAASMRLAESSDRSDDLQRRLRVAEARAHAAEIAAQKAKATLARTVLDAARVEAEANAARSNANSALEQENYDLRNELVRARKMVSTLESELAQSQRDVAAQAGPVAQTAETPRPSDPVPTGEGPLAAVPGKPTDSRPTEHVPAVRARGRDAAIMAVSAVVLCIGIILYPHTVGVPVGLEDRSLTSDGGAVAGPSGQPGNLATSVTEAVRQVSSRSRPALPTIAVNADRRARGSWLLWMPIDRHAIEESLRRAPMPAGDVSQATRATRWAP